MRSGLVTVAGLERYLGCQWKGLKCDACGTNYTGVVRQKDGSRIRKAAAEDGWKCSGDSDFCPDCQQDKT